MHTAGESAEHPENGFRDNGRTADMGPILGLAAENGLTIVEDACQALGSSFKSRHAGTFGLAGAFSFYPSKTLGCFGDGGALVTDDDTVACVVRELRDHGRGPDGLVSRWGFNARLDNLQAAILKYRLSKYPQTIDKRRALARVYDLRLRDIPGLLLPPGVDADPDHFDVFQNYEIESDRRDMLREHLRRNAIGTMLQWGGRAIHQFSPLGLSGPVPYTEQMTARFMLLPLNTTLTDDDINFICDLIIEFYRQPKRDQVEVPTLLGAT